MKVNRKVFSWAGFTLYGCILFLVLTLYRLPTDKIIAATIESVSGGRLVLRAEKMLFSFPGSYNMEGVSYGFMLGDRLFTGSLESLTLTPNYHRVLLGFFPIEFRGTMPRGVFQGKLGISAISKLKNGYFSIKVDDLPLEDLDILRSLIERELKGVLDCEMKLKGDFTDFSKTEGSGHLHVEKGAIGTRFDLPGLETVPFSSIKVGFLVKDGRMTLSRSEMSGPMLSGEVSGDLELVKKLTKGRLKMEAKMTPGPSLKNNPLAAKLLSKTLKGDSPVVIRIGGTLENPRIVLGSG